MALLFSLPFSWIGAKDWQIPWRPSDSRMSAHQPVIPFLQNVGCQSPVTVNKERKIANTLLNTSTVLSTTQQLYDVNAIIISILQIKKLRLWEIKSFSQVHIANKQWDHDLNSNLSDSKAEALNPYSELFET